MNKNGIACWLHAITLGLLIVMTLHPDLGLLVYRNQADTATTGLMPLGQAQITDSGSSVTLNGYTDCDSPGAGLEDLCERCLATQVFYLLTVLFYVLLMAMAYGPGSAGAASMVNKIFLFAGICSFLALSVAASLCAIEYDDVAATGLDLKFPVGFCILAVAFITEIFAVRHRWKAA
jgi:hypothetical protein